MYMVHKTGETFTSKRYYVGGNLIVDDFLEEGESVKDFKKRVGLKSDIDRFSRCSIVDVTSDAVSFKPGGHENGKTGYGANG